MELVNRVQILDDAICISHRANTSGENMDPTHPYQLWVNCRVSWDFYLYNVNLPKRTWNDKQLDWSFLPKVLQDFWSDIYIYIYIYYHPHLDIFIVSDPISITRHAIYIYIYIYIYFTHTYRISECSVI